MVGGYLDNGGNLHRFLYKGNTWTTLDDPPAVPSLRLGARRSRGRGLGDCFMDALSKQREQKLLRPQQKPLD